jgi:outer membrane immunogenic protein
MEEFMRKAFGLIGASLLLAGPALAADLAVKAPVYKAPPTVVPTWAGWYVGGNAGWVGSADNTVTNTGTDTGVGGLGSVLAGGGLPASVPVKYSGFLGGGQFGYNWQNGSWVYGLEADIDGSSASGSTTAVFPGGAFVPNSSTYSRELDWLATVRARVGFTVVPSFLVYGTGGLAVGETKVGSSESCPLANPSCGSEPSMNLTSANTAAGWTAGAGVEWMFAPRWSVKAEYLYVDLGNHSNTLTYTYGPNISTMTSTVRDTDNIVRGGINYHF